MNVQTQSRDNISVPLRDESAEPNEACRGADQVHVSLHGFFDVCVLLSGSIPAVVGDKLRLTGVLDDLPHEDREAESVAHSIDGEGVLESRHQTVDVHDWCANNLLLLRGLLLVSLLLLGRLLNRGLHLGRLLLHGRLVRGRLLLRGLHLVRLLLRGRLLQRLLLLRVLFLVRLLLQVFLLVGLLLLGLLLRRGFHLVRLFLNGRLLVRLLLRSRLHQGCLLDDAPHVADDGPPADLLDAGELGRSPRLGLVATDDVLHQGDHLGQGGAGQTPVRQSLQLRLKHTDPRIEGAVRRARSHARRH
mmetsp:Transcript_71630/g.232913  ORF Transcript_71630/g.232913 Transcript_71630/m.232913 type:complete len:303 (-) Transcript_71630:99-1007(-)